MPDHVREFRCEDCGIDVIQLMPVAANDVPFCGMCSFIRSIEDPVEREMVRRHLQGERNGER